MAVRALADRLGPLRAAAGSAHGHAGEHLDQRQDVGAVVAGAAVRIAVHVKPAVAGPVRVTIERFDPFAGWQFYRRVSVVASGGTATVAFTPPSVGRWRASAEYRGTRLAAPSETGLARVLVASPP